MAAGGTVSSLLIRVTSDVAGALSGLSMVDRAVNGSSRTWGMMAGAAKAAGVAAVGAMTAAGVLGLRTASNLEQANIAFTTMLGSGAKAQAMLNQLQAFAAKTPFEFPDLVSSTQQLLGMGIAANKVIPYMTAIGDAASGLGVGTAGIQRMTLAFGQMHTAGKLNMGDIKQLTELGVPAFQILAEHFHTTTGELQGMISKGMIPADEAIETLVQGIEHGTSQTASFGGMMEKQSHTMAGLWSTIKDTFQMGMANAMKPVVSILEDVLPHAINGLNAIMPKIGQGMAAGIGGVINFIKANQDEFVQLGLGLQFIGEKLSGPIVNGLKQAGPLFSQLGNFISTTLLPGAVKLSIAFLDNFDSTMSTVGNTIRSNFLPAFQAVATFLFTSLIPSLMSMHAQLMQNLAPIIRTVGSIISTYLVPAFLTAASIITQDIIPAVSAIEQWIMQKLVPAFLSLVHTAAEQLTPTFNSIKSTINDNKEQFQHFWETLKVVLDFILAVAVPVLKVYLVVAFTILRDAIVGAITIFGALWRTIEFVFNLIKPTIVTSLTFISNSFTAAMTLIKGIWTIGWGLIRGVVTTIISLITGDWTGALNNLKTMFSTFVSGAKTIWSGLKEAAAAPVRFVVNTVYNNGIRRAWNFIASKVSLPELPNAPANFATGGKVPGVGNTDSFPAWLMPGEAVVPKHLVPAIAPFLAGNGVPGFRSGLLPALGSVWNATGGRVVNGVESGAMWIGGKLVDLARMGLAAGLNAAFTPLRSMVDTTLGSGDNWKGAMGRLIKSPMQALVNLVKGKEDAMGSPYTGPVSGGVTQWSNLVLKALGALGQPSSWLNTVLHRMQIESGGNPNAVNMWDSNAKAGHPSKGLMQTIQSTFDAYKPPGGGGIFDPYANIYAGINYAIHRYGSIGGMNRSGGYDNGGWLMPGWTMAYNGTGKPENVSPPGSHGGHTFNFNNWQVGSGDVEAVKSAVIEGILEALNAGSGVAA